MFGSNPFSASSFSQSPTGPVGVTGVAATGGVGSVTVNGNVEVSVTGLGATGAVGAVVFNESVAVTGLQATGSVGSASVSVLTNVSVTGVSASMPMTSTETGASLFGGLSFSEEPFATLSDGDLLIPSWVYRVCYRNSGNWVSRQCWSKLQCERECYRSFDNCVGWLCHY